MHRGRRIAFDFGDARIGVAVSDPDSILATPVETLKTQDLELWDRIFDILREYEPVQIFVGRPLHLGGQASVSTSKAELFASELKERFDVDVLMIDERLSTVTAQRNLKSAGLSTRESKVAIDQMAAVEILKLGLDMLSIRSRRESDAK